MGILDALAQAQSNDAISMVVMTGATKRAFSAGADIKEMASGDGVGKAPNLLAVVRGIEACRVPVVAAIDGVALGGGCEVGCVIDCVQQQQ